MRPLSDVERRVLDRLLSIDFPRAAELRRQVEHITGVEPNCTCGCPSITPHVDGASAPPALPGSSMLPVELLEVGRTDGIPRTVVSFVDEDGYLSNLECVYYDDAHDEWPAPEECAVLVGGTGRGTSPLASGVARSSGRRSTATAGSGATRTRMVSSG